MFAFSTWRIARVEHPLVVIDTTIGVIRLTFTLRDLARGCLLGSRPDRAERCYLFELERRGYLQAGPYVPEVVLDAPEAVRQLHREFVRAGSDVVEAFTYYGHREKLKIIGKESILEPLNRQALEIAKEVADESGALLAGDLSNTNAYEPDDDEAVRSVRQAFEEQVGWALDADVDFIVGETFSWLGEASLALEIIKGSGKPAVITLAMHQEGIVREGLSIDEACRRLQDAGADVVGLNCSRGPATMLPAIERIRKAVSCQVAALPVPYRTTPEQPTFQSLQDPACSCLPEGRPFPVALEPSPATATKSPSSPRPPTPWAFAISGCAAAPARTTSAPSPRHSGAARRPAATRPTCRATPISAPIPRSRPGIGSTPRGSRPRCRIGGTAARQADERSSALRAGVASPQALRCSSQPSGPFPNISASLSPFGCRPSTIASTMSGARQVSGSGRQTKATVTPSGSARSVIDFAFPHSIRRRQGPGSPRPIAISKPSGWPEPLQSPAARA